MTNCARLEQISVGERDREDLGAVAELADSIRAVGLLHPIVVTKDLALVAGERRLAAVRLLGWDEVPITVVDLTTAADALRAEADENTCRKPLTPYEASRARERRARVLAEDAARRKAQAPGRPRGKKDSSSKLDEEKSTGRATRKLGAIGTGYSGSTLDKVDRIRDVAERGVIRQGKVETPAPEPVRKVAQRALGQVKQTGAAVDRSHREVEAAVEAYVETDADVRRARLRKEFHAAYRRVSEVTTFDAAEVAAALDEDLYQDVRRGIAAVNKWIDEMTKARSRGLRLVGGTDG